MSQQISPTSKRSHQYVTVLKVLAAYERCVDAVDRETSCRATDEFRIMKTVETHLKVRDFNSADRALIDVPSVRVSGVPPLVVDVLKTAVMTSDKSKFMTVTRWIQDFCVPMSSCNGTHLIERAMRLAAYFHCYSVAADFAHEIIGESDGMNVINANMHLLATGTFWSYFINTYMSHNDSPDTSVIDIAISYKVPEIIHIYRQVIHDDDRARKYISRVCGWHGVDDHLYINF